MEIIYYYSFFLNFFLWLSERGELRLFGIGLGTGDDDKYFN